MMYFQLRLSRSNIDLLLRSIHVPGQPATDRVWPRFWDFTILGPNRLILTATEKQGEILAHFGNYIGCLYPDFWQQ